MPALVPGSSASASLAGPHGSTWTTGVCDWPLAAQHGAEAVEIAAAGGALAIELTTADGELDRRTRAALAQTGVRVSALLPQIARDRDLAASDAGRRRAAREELVARLHLAHELDVPIVVAVPSHDVVGHAARESALRRAADSLDEALAAAPHGPRVAIEPLNRYETRLVRTMEDGARLLSLQANGARSCLLADTFHMNIEEDSIVAALRRHADRIGHVHIADNQRRRPGTGSIDFDGALRLLDDVGYQGALGIECSPLDAGQIRATLDFLAARTPGARR